MKRFATKPSIIPQAEVDQFNGRKLDLSAFLFDKQLAFVEDPAPFKIAVCSRRAGKTIACAAHLIRTALDNPDSVSLYITLSGVSGKRIIWKEFLKLLKQFGIKAKTNDIELSLTFPNGAVVYVAGAKDVSEIEKFRGLALKLVYIDECQSFRAYIQELIDDIIGPALMDYAGSLCLIGTPGPIPTGYFYSCAISDEWSKHHWTFWDNPHIPIKAKMTHQAVFDREMRRRGIKDFSEPSVQREWFGKWVNDTESLLFKYDQTKNHYDALPKVLPPGYAYVLGVDIGHDDADALAVLAWNDVSAVTYLVEEVVHNKQGITELVEQIQEVRAKYAISKIVMDTGGLGKKIAEEMIRRYQIPVEAADKTRKMENVELLNDAMRSGRFMAKSDSHFAHDCYLVEKDKDRSRPDKIVVSDRFHSDITDAVLYAFKISPAYAYTPPVEKPKPGTKEYADQLVDEMFLAATEHFQSQEAYKNEYGA